VVSHGSLSEAARQHNLTQPAVTRMMQRLEKELEFELFEKGVGHQIILTREGQDFLNFAQHTLTGYSSMKENLQARHKEVAGLLRLAASTTPGEYIVPRLLAGFTTLFPKVEPSLAIMDSEEVARRMAAHEFDAGFTGKAFDIPNLINVYVQADEIVLAVPPAHPLARRHPPEFELSDLENEALLVREEGSGTLQSLRTLLAGQNLTLPVHRKIMALGSSQAIISSVAAGLGVGFVSSLAVEEAGQRLVGLRLHNLPLKRDLFLVYEKGKEHSGSKLLREFIAFVTHGTGHLPTALEEGVL
jgi:DNA-binding transcriptional LysR family regulator